jgi:hypothetical protein
MASANLGIQAIFKTLARRERRSSRLGSAFKKNPLSLRYSQTPAAKF